MTYDCDEDAVRKLFDVVDSESDALQRLGQPDDVYINDNVQANRPWSKTMIYRNSWEHLILQVLIMPDGTVQFCWSRK
ncbi:MAG: hypothetical protein CMJ48_07275 [Planctomycetaceae bacterium]|nr:hypothetical protein [Planctomycetaceae bacterium]